MQLYCNEKSGVVLTSAEQKESYRSVSFFNTHNMLPVQV